MILHFFCVISLSLIPARSQTWLRANGDSDGTYQLIDSVLGGGGSSNAYEDPDCSHPSFGNHITQEDGSNSSSGSNSSTSGSGGPVFVFYIHVTPDNDRCQNDEKQRNEIKTFAGSPDELKCFEGETVSLSWDVMLNEGFQPSTAFTHIHQVKAVGGNSDMPILTLTPRLANGSGVLQIMYSANGGSQKVLKQDDLSKYVGQWLHITNEYTCSTQGSVNLTISSEGNGEELMSYTNGNIQMYRDGNDFVRPKWGIYRSLSNKQNLRDETVYYNNFCLAKGDTSCP